MILVCFSLLYFDYYVTIFKRSVADNAVTVFLFSYSSMHDNVEFNEI